MVSFQLRSLPGTAWPPVPPPDVSQLWAAYLQLDRTQWLSADQLEQLQLRQLRVLLLHCFHEVAYYRRVLTEAGYPKRPIRSLADFRRLPLLTRELYQANSRELQAQSLPAGMTAAGEGYTSGTNGVPIKVLKTNRLGLWWNALFLRDLEWSDIDPRGRLAMIRLVAMSREDLPRALEGQTVHWNASLEPLLETGPAYVMDIRQDPRVQLQWLRRVRPNCLLSLPSNLEILAGLLRDSGDRLPDLKVIQTFGEPLWETSRQQIETGFGVPTKNVYSTTEAGYIASPCPTGHGLHVHSENVIVEVLDSNDQPCRPGETGRLVFTTLHNFLAPFVRYDILDDVTLASGPCPCGRGLPLWTHVEGRRHSMLYLPDGRRKSSMGITLGVRKVGGSRQFQIIQRAPDHVVVRVVPDAAWTTERADLIRGVVLGEFESPIRVDVEERPFLERAPGGKLRVVVVEMDSGGPPA
jgi:phenylacetate-CoA ligase